MKTRMAQRVGAAVAGVGLLVGCKEKGEAPRAVPAPSALVAAPAPETAALPAPSATASASAAGEGREGLPSAKVFACGAKKQTPCPMQGWMKREMAPASASGDGAALAKALTYVAEHPPPEFGEWTGIAREGVKRAQAGDIDGAKESCVRCHDRYKEAYRATMRDRPF